jgi:hypothetical protein
LWDNGSPARRMTSQYYVVHVSRPYQDKIQMRRRAHESSSTSPTSVPLGSSPRGGGAGRKRPRSFFSTNAVSDSTIRQMKCAGVGLGVAVLLTISSVGIIGEIVYPVGHKGVGRGGSVLTDQRTATIRGGGAAQRNGERKSNHDQQSRKIYAIGLVRDMAEIQPDVLRWLAEVNCNHGVGLHIVTGGSSGSNVPSSSYLNHYRSRIVDEQSRIPTEEPNGNEEYNKKMSPAQREEYAGCAPVQIVVENDDEIYGPKTMTAGNRVERIAALRDYQRELLRPIFMRTDHTIGAGSLIIIDMDLAALPPPQRVLDVAQKLAGAGADTGATNSFPYDAICAAGVTAASKHELWYYDTYATVLWPDTFLHPLQRRLIKHYYVGENPALVRSDDRNGNWTQGDIMRYIQSKGGESKYNAFDVRSCFGGMAIYRASAWLEPTCRYGIDPGGISSAGVDDTSANGLMRYASEADGRPCEHVVFHDCLIRANASSKADETSRIAIMPKLVALWRKDKK